MARALLRISSHLGRYHRVLSGSRQGGFLGNLVAQGGEGLSPERLDPGEQFIKNTTEGEEVGPPVEVLPPDLLRRHVRGSAQHGAGLGNR